MKVNGRFLSILAAVLIVFVIVQFTSKLFGGNVAARSPIVFVVLWMAPLAVILAVFIIGALAIPAARTRHLTADRVGDTVVNSRISKSLRGWVLALSEPGRKPHFLALTGVTLVATGGGLEAWVGSVNLRIAATIRWSAVSAIGVVEPQGSLATTPMVAVSFDDERETITFPVAGKTGIAATPLTGAPLAAVAAELEGHRLRARSVG